MYTNITKWREFNICCWLCSFPTDYSISYLYCIRIFIKHFPRSARQHDVTFSVFYNMPGKHWNSVHNYVTQDPYILLLLPAFDQYLCCIASILICYQTRIFPVPLGNIRINIYTIMLRLQLVVPVIHPLVPVSTFRCSRKSLQTYPCTLIVDRYYRVQQFRQTQS
jgi:hypothetical protein